MPPVKIADETYPCIGNLLNPLMPLKGTNELASVH
jgi:hypothetical protein